MIDTFKYVHGLYNVEKPIFKLAQTNQLRGNLLKLLKVSAKSRIRVNYLSNRVINDWNSLPENVVSGPSVDAFKIRLDKHWEGLETVYEPTCQNSYLSLHTALS